MKKIVLALMLCVITNPVAAATWALVEERDPFTDQKAYSARGLMRDENSKVDITVTFGCPLNKEGSPDKLFRLAVFRPISDSSEIKTVMGKLRYRIDAQEPQLVEINFQGNHDFWMARATNKFEIKWFAGLFSSGKKMVVQVESDKGSNGPITVDLNGATPVIAEALMKCGF